MPESREVSSGRPLPFQSPGYRTGQKYPVSITCASIFALVPGQTGSQRLSVHVAELGLEEAFDTLELSDGFSSKACVVSNAKEPDLLKDCPRFEAAEVATQIKATFTSDRTDVGKGFSAIVEVCPTYDNSPCMEAVEETYCRRNVACGSPFCVFQQMRDWGRRTAFDGAHCLPWSYQGQNKHHMATHFKDMGVTLALAGSYCADPDGSAGQPWCYVNTTTGAQKRMCLSNCTSNTPTVPTTASPGATGCVCSDGAVALAAGEVRSLKSPNYDLPHQQYCLNLQCQWDFTTAAGHRVQSQLQNLDTELTYDQLSYTVADNSGSLTSAQSGSTGGQPSLDSTRTGTSITIGFTTDGQDSEKKRGFELRMASVPECSCSAVDLERLELGRYSSRLIRSQRYSPQGDYCNDIDCTWTYTTQAPYNIRITFQDFETEVTHDVVTINGGNKHAFLYGGGDNSPITSSGQSLSVRFKTDSSVTKKGFKALIEVIG